ncbi:hypothetical protein CEXT_519661 [Caerostris extrusa]|uniref:Uncharacterized protein n=1 Tax=Caerostris extrusa TaxID=172846 RepID=A0AAV4RAI9_CAEEX|nr:hypothetical protein CEXT_519661 [Caerostris extrusa]
MAIDSRISSTLRIPITFDWDPLILRTPPERVGEDRCGAEKEDPFECCRRIVWEAMRSHARDLHLRYLMSFFHSLGGRDESFKAFSMKGLGLFVSFLFVWLAWEGCSKMIRCSGL